MTHEIRGPLYTIQNSASELISNEGELDKKEAQKIIDDTFSLSERVQELIQSIMKLSMIGIVQVRKVAVDTKNVLELAIKDLGSLSEGENVEFIIAEDLPTLPVNASGLEEVFRNIIHNGIKYNSKSKITIAISAKERSDEFTFSIKDNGDGVPDNLRDHLFQEEMLINWGEGYEAKTPKIGLSIVQKIIGKHGGRVWFESKKGEGTTIFFTLPKVF